VAAEYRAGSKPGHPGGFGSLPISAFSHYLNFPLKLAVAIQVGGVVKVKRGRRTE